MILGSLLGDAGLSYRLRKNHESFELYESHGPKQLGYIKHKADILGVNVGSYHKGSKSFGPGGLYYRFGYSNKRELQKLCFQNKKKFVSKKWLENLDALAIAYWFMDDGSSSFDISNDKTIMVRFASQSFSKRENLLLMKKLLEFNIETSLRNISDGTGYNIYIRQCSVNKFMDLIEPYVEHISCMKYKIKRKIHNWK